MKISITKNISNKDQNELLSVISYRLDIFSHRPIDFSDSRGPYPVIVDATKKGCCLDQLYRQLCEQTSFSSWYIFEIPAK